MENRKYVYNESNQLSEAVLCDGKTTRKVQYTYDADGNLTGEYSPTDRSLTTYTYTVENRLEAVYTGTAYSQTLQMAAAYDGDGNRVYQLIYMLTGDEDYHEAADKMWEIQAEQRYYEKSVSLGVINGITESVYDACAVNLCSELYTLFKNPDGNKKQSKRKKFHTYLDDKALKAADKNFYNLGKSCGDIIVYFAETYFSLYGLTELGGALTNDGGLVQVARLARANGGYDTLILVNDTALAGVIEGALGAVAGILSSQSTGSNLHENLGKIDMDGMLGSEGGTPSVETPIFNGNSRPWDNGATPNSIYEQLNPDGTVKSRAFYDKNGRQLIDKILTIRILIKILNSIINRTSIVTITMRMVIGMVYGMDHLHQDIIIFLHNKEN